MQISAVDVFCGVGGLTYGLEQADIAVEAGIDVDPDCRHPYVENTSASFLPQHLATLADERPEWVGGLFDETADKTLLAGCAPCQPFSCLTQGEDSEDHEKWGLLDSFGMLVEHIEPDFVTMENVYQVRLHDVYDEFVGTLEDLGYDTNPPDDRRVFCPEYGVPQNRRRLVLLASKEGPIRLKPRQFQREENYPDVASQIRELDPIEAGEAASDDPLHRSQGLSETNLKRIQASEPGGTWEDWPSELQLECHKKSSGNSYTPVYGRMEWGEPGPTITTQFYNYGSGRFGHPEQDRPISLREGALLQTFPRDYQFMPEDESVSMAKLGRLIGNAVPPELGRVIGESLVDHLR